MPGPEYVTHVTPEDGSGISLAQELNAVVREHNMPMSSDLLPPSQ